MTRPPTGWVHVLQETKEEEGSSNAVENERGNIGSWCPWSSPAVVQPSAVTANEVDGQRTFFTIKLSCKVLCQQIYHLRSCHKEDIFEFCAAFCCAAWQQFVQQMQGVCMVEEGNAADNTDSTLANSTADSSISSACTGSNDKPIDSSSNNSNSSSSSLIESTSLSSPLPSRELVMTRLLGLNDALQASESSTTPTEEALQNPQQQGQPGGNDALQFMTLTRRFSGEGQWRQQLLERRVMQMMPEVVDEDRKRRINAAVEHMIRGANARERQDSWYGVNQGPRQMPPPPIPSFIVPASTAEQQQDETAELRRRVENLIENVFGTRELSQEQPLPATRVPVRCCVGQRVVPPRNLHEQLLEREQMREFQNTQENDERVARALQQLRQHPTPHQQRLMDEIAAAQGDRTRARQHQQQIPLSFPFRPHHQHNNANGDNRHWQQPHGETTDVGLTPPNHTAKSLLSARPLSFFRPFPFSV